ncbi:energy transducer TonB [Flavobacterium procerum]|uniref:Energy transducer TonB n=1 Tax=Flavobacterium procerum TaxID=1455569 RepID=A0ABV6BVV3_9FLAO
MVEDSVSKEIDSVKRSGNKETITPQKAIKTEKNENKIKKEDNEVYKPGEVDVLPKYPEGIQKFYAFIKKNFVVSEEIVKDEAYGAVFANMVIEKDGSLSKIEILHDFGYGSGKELERVLKLSSNWIPAVKDGNPVRCLYSMPYYLQP